MVERDAAGLPVCIVDPAGGISTMVRDRFGNVEVHTDAVGAVTSAKYDERGSMVQHVDARGGRTTFTYDAQRNLTEVTEPNGAVWRYIYDALGRRLEEVEPTAVSTRYSYSPRGDLLAVHDAVGGVTRFTYDGERHMTQTVDPKGHITAFVWGGYHRLCQRTDAAGQVVRLGYNLEGELILLFNAIGEEHRWHYDTTGQLIGEKTFDERVLRYKNDPLGRPIAVTNGLGQKTLFTYDKAGQVIARELPDGTVEAFEYDASGATVAAIWPGGSVCFERDAVGQIVREIQIVDDEEHAVEVTYDPDGERSGRRTSLGHTESIERDALGSRRRTVLNGDHVIDHVRDPLGREVTRVLPGGGRIESQFDAMGRVSRRRVMEPTVHRSMGRDEPAWLGPQANGVTAEKAYRYDWDGEMIESLDLRHGRTAHQYDPVGQLLARVPEKAHREVFHYDPAGNIHVSGPSAPVREYSKGSRLHRNGDIAYAWDDNGRLREKAARDPLTGCEQTWHYRWNDAGLLAAVTAPDGTVVELAYDPFARRVQKRVSRPRAAGEKPVLVAQTRFVWDGDVLVHEVRRAAKAAGDPVVEERTYCFQDDGFEPVAHLEGGEWFHYVNDPVGTPEQLVDSQGRIACELQRKAWGIVASAAGARAATPIRFQGQYADDETGLCYNRFRYYDPEVGRFVSPDPAGPEGGLNQLGVEGNRIGEADPFGLWGDKDVKALQTGPNGTVVEVKSKKEADNLLKQAFPNYQKVRGVGSQDAKGERKKRKMDRFKQGGAFHKDYTMKDGRVCGHEKGNPHGEHPHINIKRTDGVKVEIRIVK